jgi:sensor histidine kinase YesM
MTRMQLALVYGIILFLITWGIDLLYLLRVQKPVVWSQVWNVFTVTQLIYITTTLLVTRKLFQTYFPTRQLARLLLGVVALFAGFIALRYLLEEVLLLLLFSAHNYPKGVSFWFYTLDNLYYAGIYIFFGFLVFLLDSQITAQKTQAVLLQRTKEAELQFLRSQINPHFIFNTLNNIYSLVYEQSPKAPGAVLKLAELMRYLLYEKGDRVSLETEWNYLMNFIELQKLRFPNELPLDIRLEGDASRHEIIPHLLIGVVENAFKHGDLKSGAHPLLLHLKCNGSEMHFRVENKVGHQQKDEGGGVGLQNIRRRLDLAYAGCYDWQLENTNGCFRSLLTLKTKQYAYVDR